MVLWRSKQKFLNNKKNGIPDMLEDVFDKDIEAVFKKFDSLIEDANINIDVIDSKCNLIFVDSKWKKLYGDFIGRKCYDYFFGSKSSCQECVFKKFLKTKSSAVYEKILCKEHNRCVEVALVPIKNKEGKWFFVEINIDISKRKKALNALQESEARFRSLVEQMPAATYIALLDNFEECIYVSPQIADILCFDKRSTAKEVCHWRKRIHPDDYDRILARAVASQIEEQPFSAEYRLLSKDNNIVWVYDQAVIVKSDQGQPMFFQGLLFDISEKKLMEESLRESETQYKSLVDNLDVGVYRNTADPEGKFLKANPAIAKIFGVNSLDEFMKLKVRDLYMNPKDRAQFLEEIKKTGFIKNRELALKKKDKTPVWCSVTAIAQYDESKNIKWMDGIVEDITEKKKRDEELKKYQDNLEKLVEEKSGDLKRANEKLNEERMLFVGGPTVVYKIKYQQNRWEIEYVSPNVLNHTGYSSEDFIDNKIGIWDLVHPEDAEKIKADILNNSKKNSFFINHEYRIITKGGDIKWVYGFTKIVEDKPGKAIDLHGYAIDITERKFAEQLLRESEERYRILSETANDFIFIIGKDGKVKYINDYCSKIFNKRKEDILGKGIEELFSLETANRQNLNLFKVFESGVSINVEHITKFPNVDLWLNTTLTPIKNDIGKVESVFGISRDITAKKDFERTLKFTQFSIDKARYPIFWVNPDGKFIYANNATSELLGYSTEELLKMGVMDIDKNYPKKIWDKHWKDIKENKNLSIETFITSKDGTEYPVEVALNYFEFEGKEYVFAFIKDITERKNLEHLKDEFINTVSHELRTPLTIIKEGMLMISEELEDKYKIKEDKLIGTLSNNVIRLSKFINKILDYQKLNYEKLESNFKIIDINNLISDITKEMEGLIRDMDVSFDLRLDKGLPKIWADEEKISEVIINLINNAIKFTDKGKITVLTKNLNKEILVSVEDTGIGIKRDDLGKLFKPFSQIQSGKNRKKAGSGLGLAITKKIIELHKGRISVESKERVGTKFSLWLPVLDKEKTNGKENSSH